MRNEYRIVEKTNPSKDGILTYYQVQHKDNEKTDWGYRDNEPRWETVHEVPKSDFNWCYVGGGVRFASIDEAKDFLEQVKKNHKIIQYQKVVHTDTTD